MHDVPVNDFRKRSSARDDEIFPERTGFRSRKTEAFHKGWNDDRIDGRNVIAEFGVSNARNPNHVVRDSKFLDLRLNEIRAVFFIARDDEHGFEIGDFRNDFRNRAHNVFEPF